MIECKNPICVGFYNRIFNAVKQIRELSDGGREVIYPHQFAFADALPRHLEFCLKHEGVNLEVLKALFEKTGPQPK